MGHTHADVIRADADRENDQGVEQIVGRALPQRHAAALGDEDEQTKHEAQHQRRPARRQGEGDPQRVGDQHRDAARDAGREHRLGLQELLDFGPLHPHHYGFRISARTRVASCRLSTSTLCSAVYAGTDRPASMAFGEPVVESLWSTNVPSCPTVKDRKSTRLNSSHPSISYAVFCLKKKKNKKNNKNYTVNQYTQYNK